MAAAERTEHPPAEELSQKIKRLTEELVEMCLLETAKKYHLPLKKLSLKGSKVKRLHETEFYTVSISCDDQCATIDWVIKGEAIQQFSEETKKGNLWWRFFGFVTEKPFELRKVKQASDLEAAANIVSSTDGTSSIDLVQSAPYHAVFLMAFENREMLLLDAEIHTMVQKHPVPSLESIATLKSKLCELLETRDEPVSRDSKIAVIRSQFAEAAKEIAAFKQELKGMGFSDEDAERGADDLKEKIEQVLFA